MNDRRFRRIGGRGLLAQLLGASLAVAGIAGLAPTSAWAVTVVEHSGNTDPETEGFVAAYNDGSAVGNAWNITGDDCCDYSAYVPTTGDVAALDAAATWTFSATFADLATGPSVYGSYAGIILNGQRYNLALYPSGSDNQLLSLTYGGSPSYTINGVGTQPVTLSLVYNNATNTASAYVNGVDVLSGLGGTSQSGNLVFFGGSNGSFTNVELQSGTFVGSAPTGGPQLSDSVPIGSAGSSNNVYVTTPYTTANNGTTSVYSNLEVGTGGSYTLAPGDTLDLNNGTGTLYVDKGGVLTGNGLIEGNVLNAGLVRIPITAVSQVTGGHVQITSPTRTITIGPGGSGSINPETYVTFGAGTGFISGGGGGGGGCSAGYTIVGDAPVVSGTIGFDACLAVTGKYVQTSTGALRMFVGGHSAGGSYSQLNVGESVDLDGTLQVVLQPDLFQQFNYHPEIGDTFDFIVSDGGITLEPGLQYQFFVTSADLAYFMGFDLGLYSSGISSDPDSLYQIFDPGLFSFALIDGGDVLQATLEQALPQTFSAAPEPNAVAILAIACLAVGGLRWRGQAVGCGPSAGHGQSRRQGFVVLREAWRRRRITTGSPLIRLRMTYG